MKYKLLLLLEILNKFNRKCELIIYRRLNEKYVN